MNSEPRKSMEQKIFEYIKFAILNKEIAPGIQLTESVICEQLNVSRTPVRAAFKRLAAEGIINTVANRGSFVIQPDFDDISQLYRARHELEILMLDLAFHKITKQDLPILEQVVDTEENAYTTRNVETYFDCNRKFHAYFAEKHGNKFLLEILNKVITQSNVYTTLYDVLYHRGAPHSAQEHRKLIAALGENNKDTYKKMLSEHILSTLDSLGQNMIAYKPLKSIFEGN